MLLGASLSNGFGSFMGEYQSATRAQILALREALQKIELAEAVIDRTVLGSSVDQKSNFFASRWNFDARSN